MKKYLFLIFCFALCMSGISSKAQVSVGVSIRIAPPPLVVYTQPPCPYDGWLWCPGYWAYNDVDGYYWVPGVWVAPPQVGFLWTPGYWGYEGGFYAWHAGYWGPHVGFYGGVNYGFGYSGEGFGGGAWSGGHFRYNTAVVNVNRTVIHNTYVDRTVIHNTTVNRTSFNGPGGLRARPTAQEQVAMRENHVQRTSVQAVHQQTASRDRNQFASVNHGHPANTAMNRVNGTAFHPHTATNAGAMGHSPAAPNHGNELNPQQQSHAQPGHFQPQNNQPQQHMQAPQQNMQAPQQHMQPVEHRQQPQQHIQQPQQHFQPQQHMAPPPQQHMQPQQQHVEPQGNPHPEGGGRGEPDHRRGR